MIDTRQRSPRPAFDRDGLSGGQQRSFSVRKEVLFGISPNVLVLVDDESVTAISDTVTML